MNISVKHHKDYAAIRTNASVKMYRGKIDAKVLRKPHRRASDAITYASRVRERHAQLRQAMSKESQA